MPNPPTNNKTTAMFSKLGPPFGLKKKELRILEPSDFSLGSSLISYSISSSSSFSFSFSFSFDSSYFFDSLETFYSGTGSSFDFFEPLANFSNPFGAWS
jgi:hypothetical protein